MQVVGPFTLASGTPLVENDPATYIPANIAVQIQNNSGLTLSATIGGQVYSIGAFTAVTIPTLQSTPLTLTPSTILSQYGGAVTLTWLQPGENAPQPDGPLFAGNTNQGGLEFVKAVAVSGVGHTTILGTPPAGYAFRIHSLTLISSAPLSTSILTFDSAAGALFFACVTTSGIPYAQTFLMNGLLVNSSINVAQQSGVAVTITLMYDLVQV